MKTTKDTFMLELALRVGAQSSCSRQLVGCVLCDPDYEQIVVGYNGGPRGGHNGCRRTEVGNCGCCHAEQNALTKAFRGDKFAFVTLAPCEICATLLVNAHVKRVTYLYSYRLTHGIDLLRECKVEVVQAKTGTIYALIDPRDGSIRYIGQTVRDINLRLREHILEADRISKNHRHFWLAQLAKEGLKPEILALSPLVLQERLDDEEKWWISNLTNHVLVGNGLTNGTGGGRGSVIYPSTRRIRTQPMSEEARAKISQAQKGIKDGPLSDAHRSKLSETLRGRIFSEEHVNRLKESWNHRERIVSPEVRAKIGAKSQERWADPEFRARHREAMARARAKKLK